MILNVDACGYYSLFLVSLYFICDILTLVLVTLARRGEFHMTLFALLVLPLFRLFLLLLVMLATTRYDFTS